LERSNDLAGRTKHHLQEIQGICLHVSGRSSNQSTQLGNLHYLDLLPQQSQETKTLSGVDQVQKLSFYAGTIQRICLFSNDIHSNSILILTTVLKWWKVLHVMCAQFFNETICSLAAVYQPIKHYQT
jgi:hypothetical protein